MFRRPRVFKSRSCGGCTVGKAQLLSLCIRRSPVAKSAADICPLTEANLQCIISSPTRKEIARRLADGHSAVWVLLELNDVKMSCSLCAEQQLALDQQWLKLPTPEEMEITSEVLDQLKIKLRMQFSAAPRDHAAQ